MSERDMDDMDARKSVTSENRPILRDEVGEFCETFTQQYRGWLVAVVDQGQDHQWHVVADEQPLQALSYQVGDGHFDIRIVLGSNGSESFAHTVSDVQTIDLRIDGNGTADELTIGSANGITAVRLRSPAANPRNR